MTPIPAAEALERVRTCYAIQNQNAGPLQLLHSSIERLTEALLGPAPDEPPEWCVRCAEKWFSEKDTEFTRDLARHIARFAPGGES